MSRNNPQCRSRTSYTWPHVGNHGASRFKPQQYMWYREDMSFAIADEISGPHGLGCPTMSIARFPSTRCAIKPSGALRWRPWSLVARWNGDLLFFLFAGNTEFLSLYWTMHHCLDSASLRVFQMARFPVTTRAFKSRSVSRALQ